MGPFCDWASEEWDHIRVLHCTVPLGWISQDKEHWIMGTSNNSCYSKNNKEAMVLLRSLCSKDMHDLASRADTHPQPPAA